MTRGDIIDVLRTLGGDLRRRHMVHAGVFGSQARGDASPGSDIDVVVRFDPASPVTIFDLVAVTRFVRIVLKRRFRRSIDVVDLDGLKSRMRERVDRDALYAF